MFLLQSRNFFGHNRSRSLCFQVQSVAIRHPSDFFNKNKNNFFINYKLELYSLNSSKMIDNDLVLQPGYFSNSTGSSVTISSGEFSPIIVLVVFGLS